MVQHKETCSKQRTWFSIFKYTELQEDLCTAFRNLSAVFFCQSGEVSTCTKI